MTSGVLNKGEASRVTVSDYCLRMDDKKGFDSTVTKKPIIRLVDTPGVERIRCSIIKEIIVVYDRDHIVYL